MDPKRDLLRHALATVAYRGGKAVRGAPDSFGEYRPSDSSRSAGQVLAHLGDLFDWGLSIAKGKQEWHDSTPLPWSEEVARFFSALARFDEYLASDGGLAVSPEQLFQGPIADALTHIGQLAMMRRLAGSRVRGENYFRAEIVSGRVGFEQAQPRREFD
jgi:hypothetical protein